MRRLKLNLGVFVGFALLFVLGVSSFAKSNEEISVPTESLSESVTGVASYVAWGPETITTTSYTQIENVPVSGTWKLYATNFSGSDMILITYSGVAAGSFTIGTGGGSSPTLTGTGTITITVWASTPVSGQRNVQIKNSNLLLLYPILCTMQIYNNESMLKFIKGV
jgi:hypothetical protein